MESKSENNGLQDWIINRYVVSIGRLEERESPVSTSSIAQQLGLSLASVTEMLIRLAQKGLVEYTRYRGAQLTAKGKQSYVRLIRCRRLWEVFLYRHLEIPADDIRQYAHYLEYATSDLVAERLAKFLDEPEACPHGDLIPESGAKLLDMSAIPLIELEEGQEAEISTALNESDRELLFFLTGLKLTPGETITVLGKAPFDGTLTVEFHNSLKTMSREAALTLPVTPVYRLSPEDKASRR